MKEQEKQIVIESFTLDHDSVIAPYVREIETLQGPKGDIITSFDIRLTQPNEQEIPTAAIHTLEHLLAKYLRMKLPGYIDCSPYGCRTGFHLFVWGNETTHQTVKALKFALEQILETEWEDVPGTARKECGNYKDHSLSSAKAWAAEILARGISQDPWKRVLV